MLNHVGILVGHLPSIVCKCTKKLSVILKKYLRNPGILDDSMDTWTPYIWRPETVFSKIYRPLPLVLMKLPCKKQLIIYINNIKIIIIS